MTGETVWRGACLQRLFQDFHRLVVFLMIGTFVLTPTAKGGFSQEPIEEACGDVTLVCVTDSVGLLQWQRERPAGTTPPDLVAANGVLIILSEGYNVTYTDDDPNNRRSELAIIMDTDKDGDGYYCEVSPDVTRTATLYMKDTTVTVDPASAISFSVDGNVIASTADCSQADLNANKKLDFVYHVTTGQRPGINVSVIIDTSEDSLQTAWDCAPSSPEEKTFNLSPGNLSVKVTFEGNTPDYEPIQGCPVAVHVNDDKPWCKKNEGLCALVCIICILVVLFVIYVAVGVILWICWMKWIFICFDRPGTKNPDAQVQDNPNEKPRRSSTPTGNRVATASGVRIGSAATASGVVMSANDANGSKGSLIAWEETDGGKTTPKEQGKQDGGGNAGRVITPPLKSHDKDQYVSRR